MREAQQQLNPKVWEAVKKEILKWLNAKIIYPISDSQWVSLVYVVPKKARVTVTVNDKGEDQSVLDDHLLHGELLRCLDTKQCDPMVLSPVEETNYRHVD